MFVFGRPWMSPKKNNQSLNVQNVFLRLQITRWIAQTSPCQTSGWSSRHPEETSSLSLISEMNLSFHWWRVFWKTHRPFQCFQSVKCLDTCELVTVTKTYRALVLPFWCHRSFLRWSWSCSECLDHFCPGRNCFVIHLWWCACCWWTDKSHKPRVDDWSFWNGVISFPQLLWWDWFQGRT